MPTIIYTTDYGLPNSKYGQMKITWDTESGEVTIDNDQAADCITDDSKYSLIVHDFVPSEIYRLQGLQMYDKPSKVATESATVRRL